MIAKLNEYEGVCLDGKWKGWFFRKHPDGQWVSVQKLVEVDPMEGNPLAAYLSPPPHQNVEVPEGWKLVPERPTKAMVDAAYDAHDKFEQSEEGGWCGLRSAYRAMIAAAPPAPQPNLSGWLPIATAPLDKTRVIIAVPTKDRDDWIGGEASFDPNHYGDGDWWWAGTDYSDHHAGPVSEMNHHAPELWMPLPTAPSATTEGSDNG